MQNDAIQWIVEAAPPGTTIEDMCVRILFLNFAGIHTTSIVISPSFFSPQCPKVGLTGSAQVVTQVIYDLAAHPEFQDPLRQEVEMVIAESGGWTMPALAKMKKIDSVLRETQRLSGVTQCKSYFHFRVCCFSSAFPPLPQTSLQKKHQDTNVLHFLLHISYRAARSGRFPHFLRRHTCSQGDLGPASNVGNPS